MIITYVFDCIISGRSMKDIDSFIYSMQHLSENFILTDEVDVNKFLGIEITHNEDSSFEMSRHFLIDRLLSLLGLGKNEFDTSTTTPVAKGLLHRDLAGKPHKLLWKYRTAVGMVSYLQVHTRPDISIPVHQTSRFCNNPIRCHKKALMSIGHYLLGTKTRGIIYKPDKSRGLECYVDSDFSGGRTQADADNAENVLYRTGY